MANFFRVKLAACYTCATCLTSTRHFTRATHLTPYVNIMHCPTPPIAPLMQTRSSPPPLKKAGYSMSAGPQCRQDLNVAFFWDPNVGDLEVVNTGLSRCVNLYLNLQKSQHCLPFEIFWQLTLFLTCHR